MKKTWAVEDIAQQHLEEHLECLSENGWTVFQIFEGKESQNERTFVVIAWMNNE